MDPVGPRAAELVSAQALGRFGIYLQAIGVTRFNELASKRVKNKHNFEGEGESSLLCTSRHDVKSGLQIHILVRIV